MDKSDQVFPWIDFTVLCLLCSACTPPANLSLGKLFSLQFQELYLCLRTELCSWLYLVLQAPEIQQGWNEHQALCSPFPGPFLLGDVPVGPLMQMTRGDAL